MFAVIFKTKEVKNKDNHVVQKEDVEYLLIKDKDGWVPASVTRYYKEIDVIDKEAKLFRTFLSATEFIENWPGYPWYIKVKSYRIVSVRPTYKKILQGYLIEKGK